MDLLELVKKRQSCRSYKKDPVPRELIEKCLEAARLAPSACNSQPWTFVVIDTEPIRSRLAAEGFFGLFALNRFVLDAPVLVAVITERSKYTAALGGYLRGVQYSLIDLGVACQHFDLQAAELGLGCCWLGWFNEDVVKQVLGLPKSARIDVMFSLGYAKDETVRSKKRKELDEMRYYAA